MTRTDSKLKTDVPAGGRWAALPAVTVCHAIKIYHSISTESLRTYYALNVCSMKFSMWAESNNFKFAHSHFNGHVHTLASELKLKARTRAHATLVSFLQ